MSDLIVKLYDLELTSCEEEIKNKYGIKIIRPLTCNREMVVSFVEKNFSKQWADECETSFFHFPISMFIAVNNNNEIVGFASYEATNKDYFGPTGVRQDYRHKKIGSALLIKCLQGLKELGYAYAIIGGTSENVFNFYHKICGAETIKGSETGIYGNILK